MAGVPPVICTKTVFAWNTNHGVRIKTASYPDAIKSRLYWGTCSVVGFIKDLGLKHREDLKLTGARFHLVPTKRQVPPAVLQKLASLSSYAPSVQVSRFALASDNYHKF
ncbi:hypothetical protein QE390_002197 [Siphonobacter sp. SORGH_AS 1065]|nr:hypothetical protein [Siphonobacter sp. SORGH_AS_1065]